MRVHWEMHTPGRPPQLQLDEVAILHDLVGLPAPLALIRLALVRDLRLVLRKLPAPRMSVSFPASWQEMHLQGKESCEEGVMQTRNAKQRYANESGVEAACGIAASQSEQIGRETSSGDMVWRHPEALAPSACLSRFSKALTAECWYNCTIWRTETESSLGATSGEKKAWCILRVR